jgi:hypothetical protein
LIPSPHTVRTPSVRGFSGGYSTEADVCPDALPLSTASLRGKARKGRSPFRSFKRASGLQLYREAIAIVPGPEGAAHSSRPILPLRINPKRIADQTNRRRNPRLQQHFRDIKPIKNRHPPILPPMKFPQVELGRPDQSSPLHRVDRLGGLAVEDVPPGLHLDEDEGFAVPADEVDLVPVDLQVAQEDLESLPLQEPRGDLFPVFAEGAGIARLKEGGLRRRPVRRGKKSGDESA